MDRGSSVFDFEFQLPVHFENSERAPFDVCLNVNIGGVPSKKA